MVLHQSSHPCIDNSLILCWGNFHCNFWYRPLIHLPRKWIFETFENICWEWRLVTIMCLQLIIINQQLCQHVPMTLCRISTSFPYNLLSQDLHCPRSCKRSETLFKSLLFWLAGEVSWLAVEVLSPCRK